MSKLDHFLVSEGIFMTFPTISALCLDRHLYDHRPIILNEIHSDYGLTHFWVYHSWFKREGFDVLGGNHACGSYYSPDSINWMNVGVKKTILNDLVAIDKNLDKGIITDEILSKRMDLNCKLHELKQMDLKDAAQKAKVNWAIEGDENSKFFHGVINKRRSQLAIRGVFVSGDCMPFPNRLSPDQVGDLDNDISLDEIRKGVWDCGESKSPWVLSARCGPQYIQKVPLDCLSGSSQKCAFTEMEKLRNNFFNGGDSQNSKITWVAWAKVLSSKKNGGLGVSIFFALNRALILKWVWRFLVQDVHHLALKGFDFPSHCKIRIRDGLNTRFWLDTWTLDLPLCVRFPRLFALEFDKEISVAAKWGAPSFDDYFRRQVFVRSQWDGVFGSKAHSSALDRALSTSCDVATRWIDIGRFYSPILSLAIWERGNISEELSLVVFKWEEVRSLSIGIHGSWVQ
ncbi:hypothetical protein Tco_0816693 [Tanacetum coccineum]